MVATLPTSSRCLLGASASCYNVEPSGKPITVKLVFTVKHQGEDLAFSRWQEIGRRQGIHRSFVHVDEVPGAAGFRAEGHG